MPTAADRLRGVRAVDVYAELDRAKHDEEERRKRVAAREAIRRGARDPEEVIADIRVYGAPASNFLDIDHEDE